MPEKAVRAHARAHHLAVRHSARVFSLGARGASDVWIVCHGYGQLAGAFIRPFGVIASDDRLIVAPEALNRYYVDTSIKARGPEDKIGATWMTREDRDADIRDNVAYLDQVVEWSCGDAPRSTVKVTMLGYSQGVQTVARWVTGGKARADRVIFWAGILPDDLDRERFSAAIADTDVLLVAGESDPFATPERVRTMESALRATNARVGVVRFDGGHVIHEPTLVAIVA